jgi:hypothetical protein
MATNHYSADSAPDPHPMMLAAAGGFMPPDGIAARTVFGLPRHATVTFIVRS